MPIQKPDQIVDRHALIAGLVTTQSPDAVKPLQTAIALTYDASRGAPRVVAKGKGLVAERIIEAARDHGVFVHESRELVSLLMNIDLDQEIPPALYRAVAELLAWLYRIESGTAKPHIGEV